MNKLLEEVGLRLGAAGASSAGTTVDGAAFDMAGYDGVLIFAKIATANAGNYLKAQQGEAANLSDAADLAGSKVVADADGSVVCLDIMKPKERYIRGNIVRGGANTVTGDMYYIGYYASTCPTTNNITNTHKTVLLSSPAEGTP